MPDARIAPQDLDAEESVLGALLAHGVYGASYSSRVAEVFAHLGGGDFYRLSHGVIFELARRLHEGGSPLDPVSVADALERDGKLENVGGKVRIHELAALVPAPVNVLHHAAIVRRKARRRALIFELGAVVDASWSGELDEATALGALERAHALVKEATEQHAP